MFDRHADVIRVNTRYAWYVVAMPSTTSAACMEVTASLSLYQQYLIQLYISVAAPCYSENGRTAGQTILWWYFTQTDYRVIAIYTTAHTLLTAAAVPWTAQPTLDTANVFVFNQLYCWTTSSWTWCRFHVVLKPLNSDIFQIVLGHNVIEMWRLMSRLRRICWHSVIMHVVSVVVTIKLSCLATTFRR